MVNIQELPRCVVKGFRCELDRLVAGISISFILITHFDLLIFLQLRRYASHYFFFLSFTLYCYITVYENNKTALQYKVRRIKRRLI